MYSPAHPKRKTHPHLPLLLLLLTLTACTVNESPYYNDDDTDIAAPETTETEPVTTEAVTTEAVTTEEVTEPVTEPVTEDVFADEKGDGTVTPTPLMAVDYEPNWYADYNDPKVDLSEIVEGLITHDVYVGKDGWLFYYDCIEDYLGENLYSETMLKRIAKQMQARADWCEERGIQFYFMIAPNKITIYPEKMMGSMKESEQKRIDQVYDYLAENTTVKCIDVRDALFEAKKTYPDEELYYKYDTHWNCHGGYWAYRTAMEIIEKDFPNMYSFTREDYQIDYLPSHFKDCAYYLGYYDTMESIGPVYTKLDGKKGAISEHDWSGSFGQFANGYTDPGTGFMESCYYSRAVNRYAASEGQPSLYFIRDSFYMPMASFFRDTFSSVVSAWSTAFPNADIENYSPDIVIYECVEAKMDDTFGSPTFQN